MSFMVDSVSRSREAERTLSKLRKKRRELATSGFVLALFYVLVMAIGATRGIPLGLDVLSFLLVIVGAAILAFFIPWGMSEIYAVVKFYNPVIAIVLLGAGAIGSFALGCLFFIEQQLEIIDVQKRNKSTGF